MHLRLVPRPWAYRLVLIAVDIPSVSFIVHRNSSIVAYEWSDDMAFFDNDKRQPYTVCPIISVIASIPAIC